MVEKNSTKKRSSVSKQSPAAKSKTKTTTARKSSKAAPEVVELPTEGTRLNVYLQRHGVASRRQADELISKGLVRINRKVVTTLGTKVQDGDKVSVNGKVLKVETPIVTYIFNKPDLFLTTRKDARSRKTIFDIPALKKLPANVQPVGRLDFRSEGLLILTNDGDLAFALSHPKFHVEKTYAVLVSETFMPDDLERLRGGVDLADGFAKPLSVKLGGSEKLGGSRGQWLKIVVTEGRNRLVRRMLGAIGFKVVRLVRIGIGSIQLPDKLGSGHIQVPPAVVAAQLEKYKDKYGTVESDEDSVSSTRKKLGKESKPKRGTSKTSKATKTKIPKNYARKKEAESMGIAQEIKKRKTRNSSRSKPVTKRGKES